MNAMTFILQEIGYRLPWATEFHHNTLFVTEGNYEYKVKASVGRGGYSDNGKLHISLFRSEIIGNSKEVLFKWFDVNWTDENYEIGKEVKRLIEEDLKKKK